ncbi:MAG TPA: acetyl-CoA carboxylase biotin carboxyl carrier protein [Chthoniobacterales bacterium]|nr:acetyl-CoA carboxylase biotin carboxyl carrier protein [Chthoniobacterales bacterium]
MGSYAGDTTLELKDIRAIIDLMKKNDLAVFKLEKEGFKIELEAHPHTPALVSIPREYQVTGAAPVAGAQAPARIAAPASTPEVKSAYKEIVSPMVGTFYRAPSPDSAPYIKEGQEVAEDTVVCIIEAMKVMNEIKAEVSGEIVEVLVENGAAVQFGQPLFRVK